MVPPFSEANLWGFEKNPPGVEIFLPVDGNQKSGGCSHRVEVKVVEIH